jgi:hypothetical protein
VEPTADLAQVLWRPLDPPVIGLTIDGYRLRSDVAAIERLMLDPGPHEFTFDRGRGGAVTATLDLETGSQINLEEALALAAPRAAATAPSLGAPLALEARLGGPEPSVWPWVSAGLGAAGLGAGVWLLLQAEADRTPATTDAAGGALDTTQAEEATRWERANETALQGSVLASVGGAMILGGLTWWWLEDDAGTVAVAPTPGGLVVGGRF